MWRRGLRALAVVICATLALPSVAQQAGGELSGGTVVSPVLVIDTEQLYLGSRMGRRLAREAEQRAREIEAENTRLKQELEARERALTEQRKQLTPEEFRPLADAFDTQVQQTRQDREEALRSLNQNIAQERDAFYTAAAPVLEQLMRDSGAAVILERRAVFLFASPIDVTADAIARIDAALGDGPAQ